MKKIAFIGIAVATAMGFTACQKENLSNGKAEGQLISETFTATLGQDATKTTISSDAKTVEWAANDKVYYYSKDGGTVRDFTISAAGASASLTLEREEGDTYYNLVYAGGSTPTFTTKTSTSMVFDGVKSAQDGTFANANVSVASTTPGGSGITFKPVVSIVKFTTARTDIKTIVLTGGNGEKVAGNISVDPTASSPVAALDGDGSTSITVTIATPAAGTYYIGVLPGTYAQGLELTLKNTSGAEIGTVTASNSTNLSAGDSMINYGDVDSHIVPPVLLPGKFSVSATKQVQFTRGNLYWDGSASAWGLESGQTDYPTAWSTSHVGHFFWTKIAENSYAASYNESASAATTDKFFADGSDADHSLTIEGQSGLYALTGNGSNGEWDYLFKGRSNAANLYAKGVSVTTSAGTAENCIVIAPDECLNSYTFDKTKTSYTAEEWAAAEAGGLVCLPAAGNRDGSSLNLAGSKCYYWSATPYSDLSSSYVLAYNFLKEVSVGAGDRAVGFSVRLVHSPAKVESVSIKDVYFVISVDEQYNLAKQTTVLPDNATDKSLSWSSNNTAVATVSDDGVVTGVAAGTATITATAKDGSGVKSERVVNIRNYGSKYYLHACNDLVTSGGYLQTQCDFVLDETDYLTGTACHKTTNAGEGVIIHQRNTPQDPVNCEGVTVDNGVVVIHLYVGDASKFNGAGGCFEFTSSGQADVNELSWTWAQLAAFANGNSGVSGKKFKTGWNVIELPLSVAAPTGTTDLSKVNFYRMFEVMGALSGMELKVDTIYITYITQ